MALSWVVRVAIVLLLSTEIRSQNAYDSDENSDEGSDEDAGADCKLTHSACKCVYVVIWSNLCPL